MTAPSEPTLVAVDESVERICCEHSDLCGGCPVIHLSYAEQLTLKRGFVVQSMARYPSLDLITVNPVERADPVVAYRTRSKLMVGVDAKVGLFAKGGAHQIVDIPQCRVLAASLARTAAVLRAHIAEAESTGGALAPFDAAGQGALRGLDLREVSDGNLPRVLVTFVIQRSRGASLESLTLAARRLMGAAPEVIGVACNFHEGDAPQVLGNETVALAGVTSSADRIGTSVHFATFGSFVQAHRGQAARAQALLAAALGVTHRPPGAVQTRVLDLYGGSGAIALGLAAAGASVRLVESFAPAVAQARAAALAQGLDVQAECADVSGALRSIVARGEHFDAAIVNPPRRGASPVAREWLARLEPSVIAYLSCNAETLARDLDHFARLGYAATSVRPLDMIPLTEEVEVLAVLRPAALPPPRIAYANGELLVVEKGPHEPTAPNGEYANSLLARVQHMAGGREAVPVHGLDPGTSGLVMFARRPEHLAKWKSVMSARTTRRIYVAGVRGIAPTKGAIARGLREQGTLIDARTRYRRLAIATGHSVLRVVPDQARAHQIRRHLAAIGHPILGDNRYGHALTNRFFEEKNGLDRTFLHCVRLEFEDPESHARHVVEAPLPGDLRAVLERMSGAATLHFLDHKNALGTSGFSIVPPAPNEVDHTGEPLEVDSSSKTIRPEPMNDDE